MMIFNTFSADSAPTRKRCFLYALRLCALTMAPVAAAAPLTAEQQIQSAISKAASSEVNTSAAQQNWRIVKTELETALPPEARGLSACPTPLRTQPVANSKRVLWRLRYEVSCPADSGWTVTATVKASVIVPVVTSVQMLERGRTIGEQDIALSEQNVALLQGEIYTSPEAVDGMIVKRRINAGQPITAGQLDQPVLIERGQQVMLIASHQGIEARAPGEALKQGRKGEIIRVRNLSSQRVVDARVESAGILRIPAMNAQ